MKISEIITESRKPTFKLNEVGMNHAEDIIFFEGSAGALRVINSFKSLPKEKDQVLSIKWDGCLHPDSIVLTDNGEMRIEEVIDRVTNGDSLAVFSHNFILGENVMTEINNVSKFIGDKDWVEIEFENGDTIKLTSDHELYTTNRGWVQAGNLTSTDDVKEP